MWTFDIPTVPGFYWHRAPGMRPTVCEIVEECGRRYASFLDGPGPDWVRLDPPDGDTPAGSEWAGPILPPGGGETGRGAGGHPGPNPGGPRGVSMRVVVMGHSPSDLVNGQCGRCRALIEGERRECQDSGDATDPDLYCRCPSPGCGARVRVRPGPLRLPGPRGGSGTSPPGITYRNQRT